MKKRVWFNRWFSTGTDFIDRIKEMDIDNKYEIYVTHHNENKEFKKRAHYFEIESRDRGIKYIDFCIKFCKKHEIDIFIPKYCLHDISEHLDKFEKIGVKVMMAADDNVMKLVKHKVKFYEDCRKHNIVAIPEYYTVTNIEEFKNAYEKIKNRDKTVCYKTIISEGGLDFRIVYDTKKESDKITTDYDNLKISYDDACGLLKKKSPFHPIMVMEYMDGVEFSIDCLAYKGELLAAVPRKKVGWNRVLEEKRELIELAEKVAKIYNFSYVFNVQVRYKNGVPKLLEVNPRMSGGLDSSCMSGVNFPYLALELLDTGSADVPKPKFGMVTNTEVKESIRMKKKRAYMNRGMVEKK